MPKPGVIKFDPVTDAVRRTNGIQQPNILVHANVLQGANICGADTLQKLRDPFSERPDEVLSEEPKLYVQIMLRVVVTPINFVPSEKGSLRCQDCQVDLHRHSRQLNMVEKLYQSSVIWVNQEKVMFDCFKLAISVVNFEKIFSSYLLISMDMN